MRKVARALLPLAFAPAWGCGGGFAHFGSSPASWHGPDIGPDLAAYGALNVAAVGTSSQSFSEFRMLGSSTAGAFLGNLCDGSGNFRAWSRLYLPVTASGSGWSGSGTGFTTIDSGPGTSFFNMAGGFLGGTLLAGFGNSTTPTLQSNFLSSSWSGPALVDASGVLASPANGYASDIAQDGSGAGYLAYLQNGTSSVLIRKYAPGTGWIGAPYPVTFAGSGFGTAVQMVSDGTYAVGLFLLASPTIGTLSSVDSSTNFSGTAQVLSAADTRVFSAASDSSGNVLAASIQKNPSNPACSATTPPTLNCNYRLYGSVRNAQGVWAGPSQLDSSFSGATTTLYQASSGSPASGGIDYFTPAVAHVDADRFLVIFSITDNVALTSSIYSIGYTVGIGWDTAPALVDSFSMGSVVPDTSFRFANDFRFAGDGAGHAVLVVHSVLSNSPSTDYSSATKRYFGYRLYDYSSASGWASAVSPSTTPCPASSVALCGNFKPSLTVFPGGETAVVLPAPDPNVATSLRLYSLEYY